MTPPINIGGDTVDAITIGGDSVKEVTVDGSTVFSSLPVDYQYEYEDDSDTATAIDSIGGNDADITNATYTTNSNVGSLALDHSGSGETKSQSAVDLVAEGTTEACSLMAYAYPFSAGNFGNFVGWSDGSGGNHIFIYTNGSDEWSIGAQVSSNIIGVEGGTVSTNTYQHIYAELTQSSIALKVDGNQVASASHSQDITQLGSMSLTTGRSPFDNFADGVVDDVAFAVNTLTDTELQSIIDRAN